MRKNLLRVITVVSIVVVAILAVALGTAAPKERKFKASVSGNFSSTVIDTNGDTVPGAIARLAGNGSLGPITTDGYGEWSSPGVPATCPNGHTGFRHTLIAARAVARIENGDLFFFQDTTGTLCFDPATNLAVFNVSGNITGGTGQFLNATGSISSTGSTLVLIGDSTGKAFGAVLSEFTGTISTP
jgi:hypothetical protein